MARRRASIKTRRAARLQGDRERSYGDQFHHEASNVDTSKKYFCELMQQLKRELSLIRTQSQKLFINSQVSTLVPY